MLLPCSNSGRSKRERVQSTLSLGGAGDVNFYFRGFELKNTEVSFSLEHRSRPLERIDVPPSFSLEGSVAGCRPIVSHEADEAAVNRILPRRKYAYSPARGGRSSASPLA